MSNAYAVAQTNQRLAADPAYSVFVTANAGSGKTKVLIDRIARLLLAGSPPASFLCITFTKAAAGEMQRRLYQRLGTWCVSDDAQLAKELIELGEPPPSRERLAQARTLFARALETPGGLRIQTIHAFCERVLARFPLEAGVPPGFAIADDARTDEMLSHAWRFAIEDADPRIEAALERFGARLDSAAFDALRATFAARRGAFAKFEPDPARADDMLRLRHHTVRDPDTLRTDAMRNARWSDLEAAAAELSQGGDSDKSAADRIREALAERTLETYRLVFLKKDGDPHKQSPSKKARGDSPFVGQLFADEADRLMELDEAINAAEAAADASAALALGQALLRHFAKVKAYEGALDFDDLIERVDALFSRSSAAGWVLYKLDGGIEHVLVDEGQDTSPAQWSLIEPLQQEFFVGAGAPKERRRTVFAVGDPKQSIYGFQGADPERFLAEAQSLQTRAEDRYRGPELSMSFRSAPEVLQVVDASLNDRDLGAAEPGRSDVMRHVAKRENERGRVELWPLAPMQEKTKPNAWDAPLDMETRISPQASLAQTLAETARRWIQDRKSIWERGALRPMQAGDILVLVQSRGPLFREMLRAFKRAGLPVAGADRMVLKDQLAVQDLLVLARVALDPSDDLALATALKTPWIGLTDDDRDIFPLAFGRAKHERLIARLRASTDPAHAPAQTYVEDLIAAAGLAPFAFFSRILERANSEGVSGWELMLGRLGEEAREPIEELLVNALEAGRERAPSLQAFVHAMQADASEIKRENEEGGDAVRIMTVHGAKGLEAPVVLLADTTGRVKADADGGLLLDAVGPIIARKKALEDAVIRAAREEAAAAAVREANRLLYVAMTRARDWLIVCGAMSGGGTNGYAETAWYPIVEAGMRRAGARTCETPFGEGLALGEILHAEPVQHLAGEKAAVPVWARRAVESKSALRPVAPSHPIPGEGMLLSPRGEGRKRFRRGALIHGLLQRLPDIAPERREASALTWLKRQDVPEGEALAFAGEALGVLAEPSFAAIFGPGGRAEVPLAATLANGAQVRGVVDRLLIGAGEILVLDYKTDRPPPTRVEDTPLRILTQMALYREALRMIFPARRVRAALLWTETPSLMELPDAILDGVGLKFDPR
jgi:ATP-dependent helicase/nuclease subunit A